jgi:A/G-specific adenine glycosylase
MDLPGIGRTTAGAILAQSFNMPVPILDGNVKRVLCRVHCIEGYPEDRKVQTQLWKISHQYTSKKRAADYTQAIMDLGATCCLRSKPLCQSCPLQTKCQAYLKNQIDAFPEKKQSKKIPTRHLYMLCVLNKEGNILLEERPLKGIWGGLFSLPEFEEKEGLHAFLKDSFALKKASLTALPPFKHTFTHFHLEITPYLTVINHKKATFDNKRWQPLKELTKIGLPAPIQKILRTHFFKDYA